MLTAHELAAANEAHANRFLRRHVTPTPPTNNVGRIILSVWNWPNSHNLPILDLGLQRPRIDEHRGPSAFVSYSWRVSSAPAWRRPRAFPPPRTPHKFLTQT